MQLDLGFHQIFRNYYIRGMSYIMEWCDSDVYITFGASVEGEEIYRIDDIIYGDRRLEDMRFQLFDFSQTQNINLQISDMKVIGILDKRASHWNNRVKVAMVTTDNRLAELVEYYAGIMEDTNWQVKLFTTRSCALEWCKKSVV
jgi:hypothetical protein